MTVSRVLTAQPTVVKWQTKMKSSPVSSESDVRPPGCLYLVSTPIGNLEDITVRALRILGEVHLIACEDTRETSKLLNHYNIRKPVMSYHDHNEITRSAEIVLRLEQGEQVALVSDAGTPVISDPGHRLVALCLGHHIRVIPIPGPSAALAALAASGLPAHEFLFVGFLPSRQGERRKALERFGSETRTLVLYESPHRLADTLSDALEQMGRRPAVIARELTKIHEEFLRGDLAELAVRIRQQPVRGEVTILIGPALPGEAAPSAMPSAPLDERVEQIIREKAVDRKAALKLAARERGLTKREAYKQLLTER
jgi:16S rRNA (cytidine1402-2'-O)-methyltransferase